MIPQFLDTGSGNLFVAEHRPRQAGTSARWVLHLPAFAEEMNKSRAMVNLAARELARRGSVVIVPDLYGTGDSEGDFADANWLRWHADVGFLVNWMRQRGAQEICLWGLRCGCLLALDWMHKNPDQVQEILLWHPVHAGQQAITQFLRLRMAAGLLGGGGETVSDLRRLAAGGETLEVAGYQLSAAMVQQLDAVSLADLPAPTGLRVFLLEVAGSAERPLSAMNRKLVESWNLDPAMLTTAVIGGDLFWATQEIARAPGLVDRTIECLAQGVDPDMPITSESMPVGVKRGATEQALVFACGTGELVGIHHTGKEGAERAVLLLVGGPQYRVGSHRQFVLLARQLALAGIPVLRFDYRGMGDSTGEPVDFEGAGEDIGAAIDALQELEPRVTGVYLWGLCDAASAATFYAAGDARVAGLVLLNPWVRSEAGEARAYLKHYYLQRLTSPEFWASVRGGRFELWKSLQGLLNKLRESTGGNSKSTPENSAETVAPARSLAERFYQGLYDFQGPAQFIFSGNDLTAAEFKDAVSGSRKFRRLMNSSRVQVHELPQADHTFSRQAWKQQVAAWSADWVLNR